MLVTESIAVSIGVVIEVAVVPIRFWFAGNPFESKNLTVKVAISPCTYEALSNEAVYVSGSPPQRAANASDVITVPVPVFVY